MISTETPKFCDSPHFHCKTTNSTARLRIQKAMENCDL